MTDNEQLVHDVAVEVMGADKTWGLSQPLYWDTIDKQWMLGYPHVNPLVNPTKYDPLTNANHWMMVVERMRTQIFSFKVWSYAQGGYTATFTCDIQGDVASHTVKNILIGHAVCLAALEAVRSVKS